MLSWGVETSARFRQSRGVTPLDETESGGGVKPLQGNGEAVVRKEEVELVGDWGGVEVLGSWVGCRGGSIASFPVWGSRQSKGQKYFRHAQCHPKTTVHPLRG